MILVQGSKLGPYEILAPIGAGGMGEVWKARDTRLRRIIAIKKVKERLTYRRIRAYDFELGRFDAAYVRIPSSSAPRIRF